VTGLPGERGHGDAAEPGTHPWVTAIMRAWSGSSRTGNRSRTGHEVRDASTAHSAHRQAVVPPATGVWSSDIAYHQTLTRRHCAANAQPGPDPARSPRALPADGRHDNRPRTAPFAWPVPRTSGPDRQWLAECSVAALREALGAVAPELSRFPSRLASTVEGVAVVIGHLPARLRPGKLDQSRPQQLNGNQP
jgi:hypothetical protein